jgi:hypothetical protein
MCTTALIAQIVDVCFGGNPDAGATACQDLYTGDAAAKTCLFSCMVTLWTSDSSGLSYASSPWGGLIQVDWTSTMGVADYFNPGGCYAAAAPSAAATKCATDYESLQECYIQACAPSCAELCYPGTMGCTTTMAQWMAADNALNGCVNSVIPTSGKGACSAYDAAASTDCAAYQSADSGPASVCNTSLATLHSTSATAAEMAAAYNAYFGIMCGPAAGGGG